MKDASPESPKKPESEGESRGGRYSALMRDSWWAWLIILVFGVVGGILVSKIFYMAIPICIFSFFYFGLIRYDENGNAKEM